MQFRLERLLEYQSTIISLILIVKYHMQSFFFFLRWWAWNYDISQPVTVVFSLLLRRQDALIETLRRTKPRFVHCFLPHHSAGLVDLTSTSVPPSEDALHVPLLRSQLRGSEILPAIRLYRQGYPDYLPLVEFVRRFNVLVPPDSLPASLLVGLNSNASIKQAAEILLLHIDLERTSYRLGLSQVRSIKSLWTSTRKKLDSNFNENRLCGQYETVGQRKSKNHKIGGPSLPPEGDEIQLTHTHSPVHYREEDKQVKEKSPRKRRLPSESWAFPFDASRAGSALDRLERRFSIPVFCRPAFVCTRARVSLGCFLSFVSLHLGRAWTSFHFDSIAKDLRDDSMLLEIHLINEGCL